MASGYDIIGDIHGRADKLKALLSKLGYHLNSDGIFSHPDRQAVFVADFIDRHPQQAEVLNIVRPMVETGTAKAVQGNHEFNAVCFATAHPDGGYVRKHTKNNLHQHQAFLNEFQHGSEKHAAQIAWFKTLPVFLDLKGIFVVHACWCPESIETVRPYLNPDNTLTEQAYVDFAHEGTPFYKAIELLLKGPEHQLPEQVAFYDKDGIQRRRARISWWADKNLPTSQRLEYPQGYLNDEQIYHLDRSTITREFNEPAKPVFIGHYWMTGKPTPLSDKICCVDYSAGKGGDLVAYRWDGETTLSERKFAW